MSESDESTDYENFTNPVQKLIEKLVTLEATFDEFTSDDELSQSPNALPLEFKEDASPIRFNPVPGTSYQPTHFEFGIKTPLTPGTSNHFVSKTVGNIRDSAPGINRTLVFRPITPTFNSSASQITFNKHLRDTENIRSVPPPQQRIPFHLRNPTTYENRYRPPSAVTELKPRQVLLPPNPVCSRPPVFVAVAPRPPSGTKPQIIQRHEPRPPAGFQEGAAKRAERINRPVDEDLHSDYDRCEYDEVNNKGREQLPKSQKSPPPPPGPYVPPRKVGLPLPPGQGNITTPPRKYSGNLSSPIREVLPRSPTLSETPVEHQIGCSTWPRGPATKANLAATSDNSTRPYLPARLGQHANGDLVANQFPPAYSANQFLSLENGEPLPSLPIYRKLLHEDYFHLISGKAFEQRLWEEYMFLFQPSTARSEENPLTLYVRFTERNFKFSVQKREDGQLAIGKEKKNEDKFKSMVDMVKYYSRHPLKFEGRMMFFGRPAPKPLSNVYNTR